ncbi:MAG TPA: alpha/beta fold hydrolase [Caulobacteraceae bacterium]|nr:alpha/beta fold hydrolase [Caulobacteraceae bacterium]
MPKLNRSGVEIYYEVHGAGIPLLLSHGYSASSHMWEGQVGPFSKDYQLITWDMRGHGKSDYPEDQAAYTEAETVADMAAILDAVGAKKAIVGGLSLGGYMTLAFHLAHPERCLALLIIDTGPGYKKDEARAGWNATAIRRAENFEKNGLPPAGAGGAETRAAPHRNAIGLAKAARGMLTQHTPAVIESLPNIRAPSLVVVGAKDEPFLAASDYMAAKIPGAKKAVIPNAGHAANIDQPEAFNAAVLGFLADLKLETA